MSCSKEVFFRVIEENQMSGPRCHIRPDLDGEIEAEYTAGREVFDAAVGEQIAQFGDARMVSDQQGMLPAEQNSLLRKSHRFNPIAIFP